MKKEDMMKHFKGARTDLKTGTAKFAPLFFILLLPATLNSQIPLNGFCKYNNYNIQSGYTDLYSLNYNKDSYTDFILFNSSNNSNLMVAGNKDGSFDPGRKLISPYKISRIQLVFDKNKKQKYYAVSSRSSRLVDVVQFDKSGRMRSVCKIKFLSYPECLDAADIDNDGIQEIIVSGSGFDGISVLHFYDDKIYEEKIIERVTYTEAVFIDLNNDGIKDIAAYNLIANSLDMFYNNGEGGFKKVRSIPISYRIKSLKAFDIDLDTYEDLSFINGNVITILFGDFASAYTSTKNIVPRYPLYDFIFGEFNKDGKIDLVYLSRSENIVSLIAGSTDREFYDEIVLIKKENIKTVIPYYSKFISGIAVVSSVGNIYTVTNLSGFSDDVSISLGAVPGAITNFSLDDSKNNGIAFIDEFTNRLNLILRNNTGIPAVLYSFELEEKHSKVLVDDREDERKIFYCFSPGQKPIEVIKYNFETNELNRSLLYAPGGLLDLKVQSQDAGSEKIYIAYKSKDKLGFGIYNFHSFRYTFRDYPDISEDVKAASISLKPEAALFYWRASNDSVISRVRTFNNNSDKYLFGSKQRDNKPYNVSSFADDFFDMHKNVLYSFISSENENIDLLLSPFEEKFWASVIETESTRAEKTPFYFYLKEGGNKKSGMLYIYLPGEGIIKRLDFLNNKKDFTIKIFAENLNIRDFVVEKTGPRKFKLIYTDKIENCIRAKTL